MSGRGRAQRRPSASRAQAETIGVVLILAMTLVGATVALAFGATGLNTARLHTQEGGVEHALTQLDSRSAMVALGDSATQTVPLATSGEGGYHVDPNAGWINVTHRNWDNGGSNEVLFNETLGSLVYEDTHETIAYQGGGVWVSSGNGSRMVSPPEFHYESSTLTLPVIRIEQTASAGGSGVVATVTRTHRTILVYPNSSATYGASSRPFANPIHEGNVTVTVHSQFYEAWANYFRTRTAGEVTVNDAKQKVRVKLVSTGTSGNFQMPADGNSIVLHGLAGGHKITNFTLFLRPDDTDSANFANLQWSLYADQGNRQFELYLQDTGKNNTLSSSSSCTIRDIGASVYYSDKNGDPYYGWHNDKAFHTGCADLNGNGNKVTYLKANLTGTSLMTMQSLSNSELQQFSTNGDTFNTTANFSQHSSTVSWEPKKFVTNDQTTIGNLTNHYLSLMGDNFELTVEDKNSNTVNEAASRGSLFQQGNGNAYITYLHITENRVVIKLGG